MLQRLCQLNLLRSQQQRFMVPVITSWNLQSYLSRNSHDPASRYHNRKYPHLEFPFSSLPPQARFVSNSTDSGDGSMISDEIPSSWIRLSKRMSELDICSRREADRLIRSGQVTVDGQVAMLAEKVRPNLGKDQISIQLASEDHAEDDDGYASSSTMSTTTTIVMNKPQGYVSGQAEHGHPPAIRLLTRDRLWELRESSNVEDVGTNRRLPSSWRGFAPAGRLDLHSTGLLVFSSSGIVAKKLIHHNSKVSKEYIVDVEPAHQVSKREKQLDPNFELPKPPSTDLTPLLNGGRTLLGSEHKPLLPCVDAEWIEKGKVLRLVLVEGRKHHIRRLCREVLGYHVVKLQRVRIGPIELGDLPEGCWRLVTKEELDVITE